MLGRVVIPLCVALAFAAPASAALESNVELSALPEVNVALNDVTGSVSQVAKCSASDAEPIIVYDNAGQPVALVYVTAETDNC